MGDKSPKQKNKKAQQAKQLIVDKNQAKQAANAANAPIKSLKK